MIKRVPFAFPCALQCCRAGGSLASRNTSNDPGFKKRQRCLYPKNLLVDSAIRSCFASAALFSLRTDLPKWKK